MKISRNTLAAVINITLLISGCRSENDKIRIIDPSVFGERTITLADIADDIHYIPLDNSVKFPFIYATSINVLTDKIILSVRNTGVIRFDRDGTKPFIIGKYGRGPGEWYYCMSVAVDDRSGTIYLMDRDNEIQSYYKSGQFKGKIKLPESQDGFSFSGISFFKPYLMASQYINMGKGEYDWVILDTLGNIISRKYNSIPPFDSNMGAGGGTFSFDGKISYWNWYNDTVFTISGDLNYKASYIFNLGNGKVPMERIPTTPQDVFANTMIKLYIPSRMLETDRFFIYGYGHNKSGNLALIERKSGEAYLSKFSSGIGTIDGGITNNLDCGLSFTPWYYFTENGREYLLSVVEALSVINRIKGDDFRKASALFPELKTRFETFGSRLTENDNPVLMIVRLKK